MDPVATLIFYTILIAVAAIIAFYTMSLDSAREKEAKTGKAPNVWD